ncbi:MAG: hypothetical protein AXA67_09685 [Methylothermaceae bacteria B42]|nr:MAG: hypothetical protein AXA67_09685 [Methylothermaceae bacteria B42]HHJ39574.1 Ppx/GppA family phosphatase [Methylothermaceae bacterium]
MNDTISSPLGAVIDIGSNAIRLRIGGLSHDGKLDIIEAIRAPVRLGQDAFKQKHLGSEIIERAVKAFTDFRQLIDRKGIPVKQVRAVATSAVRSVDNRQELIDRVHEATEIEIDVISGAEEARLVYLAIRHALPELSEKNALLIDIGGGSVEIIVSQQGQITALESFKMGTVRLLTRFGEQKNSRKFLRFLDEFFSANAGKIQELIDGVKIEICVGTGGNIETLGELGQRLLGNNSARCLSFGDLKQICQQLDDLDYQQRVEKLKLRPDRADVIIPASHTLREIMKLVGKPDLLIPGVGLAEGVLLDLLQQRRSSATQDALDWARAIARKFHTDMRYAEHVRQLALQLFDQLAAIHELPARDRLLLEMAALVHEIGVFIRPDGHHRHAYYLLNAMPMIGISEQEQKLLATIVRCQRKRLPDGEHELLKPFNKSEQQRWLKLTALLRLAIALNKERQNVIEHIHCRADKNTIEILCTGKGDMLLEQWAVLRQQPVVKQAFDRQVRVVH